MSFRRIQSSSQSSARHRLSRTTIVVTIVLIALMATSLTGGSLAAASLGSAPAPSSRAPTVPPGYSTEIVQVKFRAGSQALLPTDLAGSAKSIAPLFSLPKRKLKELKSRGESRIRAEIGLNRAGTRARTLPDLSLWFKITLKPGTDANEFITKLRLLDGVEIAEPAPLPAPPPAVTPDFTGNQGYLNAATGGIDADYSWTQPGGDGSGIKIYDVEYSWNQTHEDLSKANGVSLLLNSGDSADDPFSDNNHGTAVLGELIADNDTKGVTGISHGADIGLAPANTTNLGYDPANAILLAVADGSAGDVILIEQQTDVCGLCGEADCTDGIDNDGDGQIDEGLFGPLESVSSVYDAIQTATANGFVVVEAAGNGGVNLDQAACGTTFDRTVRDSGAIIVGAGGPPTSTYDREREGFSSYGSRVDLQGWGSGVMTTGYGSGYTNADDPTNPDFWYTSTFAGTSSASPIVAGAVANLQGFAINQFGTPLTAFQIRELLGQIGSPQLGNTAQNIGPRPNLRAVIDRLTQGAVDIFILVDLSGSFTDDLPNFKAQAPGIINTLRASNPNTRFGLGSFEDYPISPFGSASDGDVAYRRNVDLTFNTTAVTNTILGLSTRNGVDEPESQLAALYQAASGAGQDLSGAGYPGASIPAGQQANFRNGATKLLLLWTDAEFHLPDDPGDIPYPGPSFVDTVDAILALDPPKVFGISSGGGGFDDLEAIAEATDAFAPAGGIDCDGDGTPDIAEGEPVVCIIAESGEGIGDAIVALVEEGINLPPLLTVPGEQNVQYSDWLSFDVLVFDPDDAASDLALSAVGLPSGLNLTYDGAGTATVEGFVQAAAGTYEVEITVTDPDGLSDTETVPIVVSAEDASLVFGDNPIAVEVAAPGGNSGPFALTVYVREIQPDQPVDSSAPGDIYNAEVRTTLEAVGPGGSYTTVPCTKVGVTGTGYDAILEVECDFDDVAVNTYHVQAMVVGDYYTSDIAEDVLVVYDPSLGFATGGGWFYWPDTGERTNFGFTMKYNKKGRNVKGKLLLIRHMPDGSIYRVKSNALYGLALGEFSDPPFGWASFSGKSTYLEPGWLEPIGNYNFLVYVEDRDEPGTGVDRFWIEVKDKDREIVPVMSMDREATDNAVELQGGNIAVPH